MCVGLPGGGPPQADDFFGTFLHQGVTIYLLDQVEFYNIRWLSLIPVDIFF